MANRRLADLSDNDRQELEAWLVDFDKQWGDGALPEQARRLSPTSSWRLPALCEMVKIDLERQWAIGNRLSLENYLEEYPELGNPADVTADLIQAEYEVRKQFGAAADLDDYARRFPAQIDELRRLIAAGHSSLSFRRKSTANMESAVRRRSAADMIQELPEEFGRYRILHRLGAGGMGSVYLAEDSRLKRKVALKVAHISGSENREVLERFYREAEAAAGLDHPYLCKVYDVDEIENVHYLTMEYIEGTSLADFIAGRKDRSQRQVAAIVGKLATALQEAHAKGVVHRDLKPANVMIRKTGQRAPVIVDFGLAQQINTEGTRLTQTGQAMGTPHYMAVEQIKGDLDAIGPACDIYALGVILYELLTGQVPFDGPMPMVVVAQILTTQAPPPSSLRPDLDPNLEAICLKAMAREIKDRYASMADFAAALNEYLKAPATAVSDSYPVAPPEVTGERPSRAQGSDTLMGRFLENPPVRDATTPNSDTRSKVRPVVPPAPAPAPVSQAEAEGPRTRWPMIAGLAAAFVSLLLGVVVYVVTDKGRIKITVDGPKIAVKVDGAEVSLKGLDEPITLRAGEHEMTVNWGNAETITRKFVVRRGTNEDLRIEYEPAGSDKVTSSTTPVLPNETGYAKESTDGPVTSGPIAQGRLKTITNSIGMELTLIPAGEFRMGSSKAEDKYASDAEQPRHRVRITRPFYLGVTEVTQGEYRAVTGQSPSEIRGSDDQPVERVSWRDAVAFCNTLSAREGLTPYYIDGPSVMIAGGNGYRLPTEAEWEYACRAGTTTTYSFGDDASRLGDFAWIGMNSGQRTHPVREKPANAFGLYDMHGNVFEWCWDGFDPGYYRQSPPDDPTGPAAAPSRVHRGGGFTHAPESARSADRAPGDPDFRNLALGFRVGRALSKSEMAAYSTTPGLASDARETAVSSTPDPARSLVSSDESSRAGEERDDNALKLKLCWCPPGSFRMGSPTNEPGRGGDEGPVNVTLSRGFWMGQFEVTQSQWQSIMGTATEAGRANHPMSNVSHEEAEEFCRKLTESERGARRLPRGWEYRLPTEAQWEYACRAGTTTATAFGDQLSSRDANFKGDAPYNGAAPGPYLNQTAPVGRYRPNPWGIHDMHGNVWEWCRDGTGGLSFFDHVEPLRGGVDPVGPGSAPGRVIRGGSWRIPGGDLRSAFRLPRPRDFRYPDLGFRVALVPSGQGQAKANPGGSASMPENTEADAKPDALPADVSVPPGAVAQDGLKKVTNSIGMKLALIPAGEFLMGSSRDEDAGAVGWELPRHRVRITRRFYMGVTEVTQGQYRAVTGQSPSYFKGSDDLPVEQVTWHDAIHFCTELSRKEGLPAFYDVQGDKVDVHDWRGPGYRLPTEAEREYAGRAGSTTRFSSGKDATDLARYAWFNENSGMQSHPVGLKAPNAFGLFDMQGNLWEWCWDRFDEGYYARSPVDDPTGPSYGAKRVDRGGSWRDVSFDDRSASRYGLDPGFKINNLGFRVARYPSEPIQADVNPGGSVPAPESKAADVQLDAKAPSAPRYSLKAESLFTAARNLEKSRKLNSAVKAYERVIKDYPNTQQAVKAQTRIDILRPK